MVLLTMVSDFITPKELECVLVNMKAENALAMWVALETGLRIGDVLKVRQSDINGKGVLSYVASKTGKSGKVKLSRELVKELRGSGLLPTNQEGWVFVGRDGKSHRTRQAVYKDVKKAVEKVGKSLEGKQISPHTARKVHAYEIMRDKGITAAQKALQHSSMLTTMIYLFQGFDARLKEIEGILKKTP